MQSQIGCLSVIKSVLCVELFGLWVFWGFFVVVVAGFFLFKLVDWKFMLPF